MNDPTLPLFGLSPVSRKTVVAKFDGGLLSSDGGVLVLREIEQRLCVADQLAAYMVDSRLLMSLLRGDFMFKMALDLSSSDHELCSQSMILRLEK
jgi:hypothetical protein